MTKGMKNFLIICGILIGVGLFFSIIGIVFGGIGSLSRIEERFPWISLSGGYEERITLDLDPFHSIDLDCDTAQVQFIQGDKYAVEMCYDHKLGQPAVSVKNDILSIDSDGKHMNHLVSLNPFGYEDTIITVYYPKGITFEQVKASCDMGSIELSDLTAKKTEIETNSGYVTMSKITTDTLKLSADMGGLEGTSIKSKNTNVQTDAGSIELEGRFTGKTNLSCDMGSCILTTDLPKKTYAINASTDMGSCTIDNQDVGASYTMENPSAANRIEIKCDAGSTEINFK